MANKDFPEGVSYYTSGMLPVHFPEDRAVCHWCILLDNDNGLNRSRCGSTGEIIPAPLHMRGAMCPIGFLNEEEDPHSAENSEQEKPKRKNREKTARHEETGGEGENNA